MPRTDITTEQRQRARTLRASATGVEQAMWRLLKGGRMLERHFRRQAPIGPYIADFVCHSDKLVIEADGDHHGFASQRQHDVRRDAWLASQGYWVLRFTNGQILKEPESVGMTIEAALEGGLPLEAYAATPQTLSDFPPSPTLPHEGGGSEVQP